MKNEIRFRENLRILRAKNSVSQQELADVIHIARQTLSAWEHGRGKPDIYCVHDICKYFNVTIETILYGNILCKDAVLVQEEKYEFTHNIKDLNKQGFYTVIDEDLEDFFWGIKFDLEHIAEAALALSKQGYLITEVFNNGFSIYLKSDKEAVRFQRDLYDTLDCYVHHDNSYIEEKCKEIENIIYTAYEEVINNVMKEIIGADINSFAYYWVDKMENLRGYANTKAECKEQAKFQMCENYIVFPMV